MKKSALAAAAILAATAFGGVGEAEAHGKHFRFHQFYGPSVGLGYGYGYGYSYRPRVVIGSYGPGCGFYYDRWMDTGSFYWKKKFLRCRAVL